jgi:hypothetical protein
MEKDFSHPLEMTNKNSESVISNEERDLSELHHYPDIGWMAIEKRGDSASEIAML